MAHTHTHTTDTHTQMHINCNNNHEFTNQQKLNHTSGATRSQSAFLSGSFFSLSACICPDCFMYSDGSVCKFIYYCYIKESHTSSFSSHKFLGDFCFCPFIFTFIVRRWFSYSKNVMGLKPRTILRCRRASTIASKWGFSSECVRSRSLCPPTGHWEIALFEVANKMWLCMRVRRFSIYSFHSESMAMTECANVFLSAPEYATWALIEYYIER